MTDVAIRVQNLSKQYPSAPLRTGRTGGPPTPLRCGDSLRSQARYETIRESLTEVLQAPFRRLSSTVRGQSSAVSDETIWALKDVSFEVQRGEVVGIIGRNGAMTISPPGATALRPPASSSTWKMPHAALLPVYDVRRGLRRMGIMLAEEVV